MKKILPAFCLFMAAGFLAWNGQTRLFAQSAGDQILDGIGETALIARYLFDGDILDRSRNQFHALAIGAEPGFPEESPFGRVLSLRGGALRIPGRALAGTGSLSVTCWVHLVSMKPGQRLFDFADESGRGLFCELIGPGIDQGFRAGIAAGGSAGGRDFSARFASSGRWFHLAVVLDQVHGTLTGYIMGRELGRLENPGVGLAQILDLTRPDKIRLLIGASSSPGLPFFEANLRDFRLYGIALSPDQVRAVAFGDSGARRSRLETEAPPLRSLALSRGLREVPDITVTTTAGILPRLPVHLAGIYENGSGGPPVRVIWPAPTDNSAVLETGTYTLTGTVPGTAFRPRAVVTVLPVQAPETRLKPEPALEPFPLDRVVLNRDATGRDTPFMKNRDKFLAVLSELNPDNFLYNFRDAFGQPQPEGAVPLAGWDSQTTRLRGHASGHYLTALAQAWAGSAYDPALQANFLGKMNQVIDTLHDLARKSGRPKEAGGSFNADPLAVPTGPGRKGYDSDLSAAGIRRDYWNWGRGYISAYPPDQFIMLEQGATYGASNAQIWAPYYTLHKILTGLLDSFELGGNTKALETAEGMATWVLARLQAVPEETRISMWSRYIAGEYGGMNEALARLARLTGKEEFLAGARLFDNTGFFFGNAEHKHGLAKNVDTLRGLHANQHIPQVTGALETFRVSGDPAYRAVAANFWNMVREHYSYSIGGTAGAREPRNAECFTAEPDTIFANGFSMDGQNETCATYNLLKLSRGLFFFEPDSRYMDYYEQGLYNHILASVAEKDAGNTYHVPLNPGARKHFSNESMDAFTCCNGTALESHTKLQNSIYFRSADHRELYVNLYIPSTLSWKERGITVVQSTNFPYSDSSLLTIHGGGVFTLKVRVPAWATRGFQVRINGRSEKIEAEPGSYLALSREWRDGDSVELHMPFSFRLEPVMDMPNLAGIFYGPVLLAVQEEGPLPAWRKVILDAEDISHSITGDPAALRFTLNGLVLQPFFESYGHHSVYLDVTLQ